VVTWIDWISSWVQKPLQYIQFLFYFLCHSFLFKMPFSRYTWYCIVQNIFYRTFHVVRCIKPPLLRIFWQAWLVCFCFFPYCTICCFSFWSNWFLFFGWFSLWSWMILFDLWLTWKKKACIYTFQIFLQFLKQLQNKLLNLFGIFSETLFFNKSCIFK
jgi:hypothetical protein